jgi:hypothetical protein
MESQILFTLIPIEILEGICGGKEKGKNPDFPNNFKSSVERHLSAQILITSTLAFIMK